MQYGIVVGGMEDQKHRTRVSNLVGQALREGRATDADLVVSGTQSEG